MKKHVKINKFDKIDTNIRPHKWKKLCKIVKFDKIDVVFDIVKALFYIHLHGENCVKFSVKNSQNQYQKWRNYWYIYTVKIVLNSP